MHEHVGEELPETEAAGGDGIEGAHAGDIGIAVPLEDYGCKEYYKVNYQQVFYHWREHAGALRGWVGHVAGFFRVFVLLLKMGLDD